MNKFIKKIKKAGEKVLEGACEGIRLVAVTGCDNDSIKMIHEGEKNVPSSDLYKVFHLDKDEHDRLYRKPVYTHDIIYNEMLDKEVEGYMFLEHTGWYHYLEKDEHGYRDLSQHNYDIYRYNLKYTRKVKMIPAPDENGEDSFYYRAESFGRGEKLCEEDKLIILSGKCGESNCPEYIEDYEYLGVNYRAKDYCVSCSTIKIENKHRKTTAQYRLFKRDYDTRYEFLFGEDEWLKNKYVKSIYEAAEKDCGITEEEFKRVITFKYLEEICEKEKNREPLEKTASGKILDSTTVGKWIAAIGKEWISEPLLFYNGYRNDNCAYWLHYFDSAIYDACQFCDKKSPHAELMEEVIKRYCPDLSLAPIDDERWIFHNILYKPDGTTVWPDEEWTLKKFHPADYTQYLYMNNVILEEVPIRTPFDCNGIKVTRKNLGY